jgi:nucleotide-binding universal stress UspA family protein
MHRIGVAVDGSAEALAAVHWAHELAGAHAEIRELQLVAVDAHARGSTDSVARGELLTSAAGRHAGGQAQPAVRWTQRSGYTPHELVELSLHLDLLVVGTHGRGGMSRLLHGSVSRDTAQRARCPVVVVPAAL